MEFRELNSRNEFNEVFMLEYMNFVDVEDEINTANIELFSVHDDAKQRRKLTTKFDYSISLFIFWRRIFEYND